MGELHRPRGVRGEQRVVADNRDLVGTLGSVDRGAGRHRGGRGGSDELNDSQKNSGALRLSSQYRSYILVMASLRTSRWGSVPTFRTRNSLGTANGVALLFFGVETRRRCRRIGFGKQIAGFGSNLTERSLLMDSLRMHLQTRGLKRNPKCPTCGTREPTALEDDDKFCDAAPLPPPAPARVRRMSPVVLASRREVGDELQLIDVRDPLEWDVARIRGARLIPLETFVSAADTIDHSREIVVYCHHGVRSLATANYLADHGFPRVWNLAGGIDRYSVDVDRDVSRY